MRHVKTYKIFESKEDLSKEQIDFLDRNLFGFESRWEFDKETGLVDVYGSFNMVNLHLPDFKGVRFGRVTGNFSCDMNELTSLEGSPQEIGGVFDCSSNNLKNLDYFPLKIGGTVRIIRNKITSLEGCPEVVNGDFQISNNKLTDLIGGPKNVKGNYYCGSNPLESLEGIPDMIGGVFDYEELLKFHGSKLGLREFISIWNSTFSNRIKRLCKSIISEEYLLRRYEEDPEGTIMYIGKDWSWIRENYPKLYPEFREKIDKSDSETLDDLGDLKDLGF